MLKNFKFAFLGIKSAASERTFQIFCVFAVAVIVLMFLFKVSLIEKLILIMTIAFTMALELINSQIERVLDIFQPNHDSRIKVIKDISAGAVLIVCFGALIIGILIFWPYFK